MTPEEWNRMGWKEREIILNQGGLSLPRGQNHKYNYAYVSEEAKLIIDQYQPKAKEDQFVICTPMTVPGLGEMIARVQKDIKAGMSYEEAAAKEIARNRKQK